MSKKFTNNNNKSTQKSNFYLLSSWNYGSYSPTNPFYKSYIKSTKSTTNTNPNLLSNKKSIPRSTTATHLSLVNSTNYQSPKRFLKEEERIVTNEIMDCYVHYNKMQKHIKKGTFRPKSVNRIITSNLMIDNTKKMKKIKTNIINYKYKLTFTEWINIKNKQREIFNEIVKKRKSKEEDNEEMYKRIDLKYQEVKEQKIKEWARKKDNEKILKKKIEKKKEILKEEEKKEREERKEEIMNKWFKEQAKKMEKEIEYKKKKKIEDLRKKNLKIIEKNQKKILNMEAFREWKLGKDLELKKRRKEEKIQKMKNEAKKKREYLKKRVKGFIIGPYTDAAALKEVQNIILENNLNENESKYFQEKTDI